LQVSHPGSWRTSPSSDITIAASDAVEVAVGVARRAGAAEIVVSDLHEAPLEIARAVGATQTLHATTPSPSQPSTPT
jgi:Zn-dependent alcohol dehydrogenase